MKTFVYVISGDHGRQKIGCSDNPRQRIKDLQTGSPFPLKFEFIGEAENGSGGQIEVEAHFMLAQHRAEGEWFVVPPDVAVTAVMAAAHRLGYRCKPVDSDAVTAKTATLPGRPWWDMTAQSAVVIAICYSLTRSGVGLFAVAVFGLIVFAAVNGLLRFALRAERYRLR